MTNLCEQCDGSGFTHVEKDGREYAVPCTCRSTGRNTGTLVESCRIPPRYEHCTLEHFTPGTSSQREGYEKVLRYCRAFPHLGPDEGLGLLFTGGNGVGKTHLSVAVLQELVEQKGVRGQFWDFNELIREIRNSYNPETHMTEMMVLEPVVETDLLVLDDLGAWKMTDWMNDTLFSILNSRYLARKPTVVTTNYQDADLDKVRAADSLVRREYLVERIGQRLRSRLMEMCLVVPLDGPDFRQMRQQGHQFVRRS